MMSDSHSQQDVSAKAPLPADEQSLLDTALQESDQLLVRSLQDDQRRRARRWLWILVIGGVVMFTLVLLILFGGLTLGLPGVAEGKEGQPTREEVERAEALATEGWRFWQNRQFAAAADKFEDAVNLDPQAADAWNGLGWSRFNGGESEQALAAFEKCVALQPRHPAGLNGLGQLYLSWKQYAEAEKYLLLAAPQAPAAAYGLARLYLLQEKFSEAKPWVEKLAAQTPADENIERMLKSVEEEKLDEDLRRTLEPPGKPKTGSADAARGWTMFRQGRMQTAERLFRRAVEADGENLSALNGLAFCLLSQGNHEQAQPLFEKCLAREKDAAGPMNGLARCLKASGNVDDAIELWERMAELYPGPNAAAVGLAATYLEQKEYAKSIKHFEVLVEANPDNEQYQNGLKTARAGLAAAK
jgi:tetratricopeptide (TPR) repeat protein